ncbi:MAG: T9SS type A sorting domain-containing protein [Sphingobacteriales bacterium]|nr:MAG: T9SS type A sorting domain-containing protein [Sphingobacteriales bacterium]
MKKNRHINYRFALLFAGLLCFGAAQAQTSSQTLEGNNIKALFNADGQLFWDGKNAHFEVPKNSGTKTISAASLWIGGLDSKGDLHLSAQTYRESGSDFWPGPLDANGKITEQTSAQFNKIWKVTKLQIDSFKLGLGVPQSIMDWPQAAPYIDKDKNGSYEPIKGDYPDIKGDEMLWWVFNDNLRSHTETKGLALGLEIQASAYTFNCNNDDILKNTVFLSYKIINKSLETYKDVYAGIWADFDIGNLFDDYVGSDSTLNTFYAYNADGFDNDTIIKSKSGDYTYKGFGKMLPVQSLTYLQGLKDDNGSNMNMSKFIYFNNEVAPTGNPTLPAHFYNLLRGYWLQDKSLDYGADGYYGTGTKANFAFPGNINNPNEWTELSAKNKPGDRRGLGSFGPITLSPGETQEITAAFLYTQASSGQTNRAVDAMKNQVSNLIKNYKSNSLSPCTALSTCSNSSTFCVWPGDADNDGKASVNDIFNIGYAFGETGPERPIVSTAWMPQTALDWSKNLPTGVNYKYADTDGNGKIDSADVMPLLLNLGEKHNKGENGEQATDADPVLSFDFEQDSAVAGRELTAVLRLGSNNLPADNIYGVSGRVLFESGFLEPGTIQLAFSGSDLGVSTDLIVVQNYDFVTGSLDFGISRKNKSGKTVKDIIIRWKYVIDPNVAGNKQYHAKMEAVTVVDANLKPVTVNTRGDEVRVAAASLSISKTYRDISNSINLYPNPAQQNITLDLQNNRDARIRILTMQGQEMYRSLQETGAGKITLPVNHFPPGIYMVEIQTAGGRAVKKFSKL